MDLIRGVITAVLPGAIVTLEITVGAWSISVLLGLLLAVVRQSGGPLIGWPLTASVFLVRSVPQLIVLYIVFFGLGYFNINLNSLTAAIVGLGIAEAVYSAEYFRAGFITVPATQHDAGLSMGLSKLAVMRLIVIPQAIPFLMPPLLNSLVGLMKGATLAAAIGAPEILYQSENYMTKTGQIGPVALVIIGLYLVVTIPLTRLVGRLEVRVRSQYVQAK
jgi:His/Glu/Gln/Arg/opine family amino acid ABC transporter permease subunit